MLVCVCVCVDCRCIARRLFVFPLFGTRESATRPFRHRRRRHEWSNSARLVILRFVFMQRIVELLWVVDINCINCVMIWYYILVQWITTRMALSPMIQSAQLLCTHFQRVFALQSCSMLATPGLDATFHVSALVKSQLIETYNNL
jgi:hypothetical protein